MFENVKMSFRLIKKANKLVLWDFLRLAKKSRLWDSSAENSRKFTTPYYEGVPTVSFPQIHCRPSSLPDNEFFPFMNSC